MSGYYAKSDGRTTVAKHLEDVAFLAGEYGRDVGMPGLARTVGWLHDTGKYGKAFQEVLAGKRTGVDHVTARWTSPGCRRAWKSGSCRRTARTASPGAACRTARAG